MKVNSVDIRSNQILLNNGINTKKAGKSETPAFQSIYGNNKLSGQISLSFRGQTSPEGLRKEAAQKRIRNLIDGDERFNKTAEQIISLITPENENIARELIQANTEGEKDFSGDNIIKILKSVNRCPANLELARKLIAAQLGRKNAFTGDEIANLMEFAGLSDIEKMRFAIANSGHEIELPRPAQTIADLHFERYSAIPDGRTPDQ